MLLYNLIYILLIKIVVSKTIIEKRDGFEMQFTKRVEEQFQQAYNQICFGQIQIKSQTSINNSDFKIQIQNVEVKLDELNQNLDNYNSNFQIILNSNEQNLYLSIEQKKGEIQYQSILIDLHVEVQIQKCMPQLDQLSSSRKRLLQFSCSSSIQECSDCNQYQNMTGQRQEEIKCRLCVYGNSKKGVRPDGSCSILPTGQTYNVWGDIEGCDSSKCTCSSDNKKCVKCLDPNTYYYPDFETCDVCRPGRFLKGNICLKCDPNGQFMEEQSKQCFFCKNIITSCQECNKDECFKCIDGYGVSYQDKKKCISCQDSTDLQVGKYCIKKPDGCKTLSESSINPTTKVITCDECVNPDTIKEDDGSCSPCPDQTYYENQSCKQCKQNCKKCPNNSTCTKCNKGYWMNKTNNKCEKCSENCIDCKELAICLACTKDMILVDGQCTLPPSLCIKQPRGYMDQGICKKCGDGKYYNNDCSNIDNFCGQCKDCQLDTQYVSGTECKDCPEYCSKCDSNGCSKCSNGFSYNKNNKKCECKDITKCLVCTEYPQTGCFKCANRQFFYSDTSNNYKDYGCDKGTCPPTFLQVSNKSNSKLNFCFCNSPNCKYCTFDDATKCSICDDGYQVNQLTGLCEKCNGFYIINKSTLICECNISNCSQCSSDNNNFVCKQCNDNYELTPSGLCSKCKTNFRYGKTTQKCLCDDINCIKCDTQNGKLCQQCQTGFTLTNDQCQEKKLCNILNCSECDINNLNQCKTCNLGYKLNAQFECEIAITNCIQLQNDNPLQCQACKTNFELDQNICKCSIQQCKTCNSDGSKCEKCNDNYYRNDTNTACVTCSVQNCKECTDGTPDQCKTCEDGYKQDGNNCKIGIENCIELSLDKSECTKCKTNYQWNSIYKLCECVQKDCKNCEVQNNKCNTCQDGFQWSDTQMKCVCNLQNCQECGNDQSVGYGKCKNCKTNYDMNDQFNGCICNLPNCKTCNSDDGSKCDICNENYIQDLNSLKCKICSVLNCKQCQNHDENKCQTCEDGYQLSNGDSKCKIIIPHCLELNQTDPKKCKKCETNYQVQDLSNSSVCQCKVDNCINCDLSLDFSCNQCEQGFTFSSSSKKCECKINNCAECSIQNYGDCQKCQQGYIPSANKKECQCTVQHCNQCNILDGSQCDQCEEGYVFDTLPSVCSQCSVSNCKKCYQTSPTHCQQCNEGYKLNDNDTNCTIAIDKCILLNKLDPSVCDKCETNYHFDDIQKKCLCNLDNCQNCMINNLNQCSKCEEGFSWDDTLKKCICSIQNCSECSTSNYGSCQKCVQGYLQVDNKTCKCNILNCNSCNKINGLICDNCNAGYVSSIPQDQCIQCQAQNCEQCKDFESNKCKKCQAGYKLDINNNCVIGIENCKEIESGKTNECKVCQDDYIKTADGQCQCKFTNCKNCQILNNNECKECEAGFQWSINSCKCSIQNCSECDVFPNYGNCKKCATNYIAKDSQTCQCSVQNCLTCNLNDGSQCDQCQENHVFENGKTKCSICTPQNCKNCKDQDSSKCQNCNEGYDVDFQGLCKIKISKCTALDSADPTLCTQCKQNYQPSADQHTCECKVKDCSQCDLDSFTQKCKLCENGFIWSDSQNKCICNLDNCTECERSPYGLCKVCNKNYELQTDGTCKCSVQNCTQCDQNDGSICEKCNTNYVLNTSKQECNKCEVLNCLECTQFNQNSCKECNLGYKLFSLNSSPNQSCKVSIQNCEQLDPSDSNKCKKCLENYELDSNFNCKCKLQNCKECNIINNECKSCEQGFQWQNSPISQCQCIIPNCLECENTPTNLGQCKQCINNFEKKSNGSCVCSVFNCKNCSQSDGKICEQCVEGFILDQTTSQCNKCQVNNCQQCKEFEKDACKVCNDGYKQVNNDKKCQISIDNCIELESTDFNKCKKCGDNFEVDPQTFQCKCKLEHCKNCKILNDECLACQDGYEWNPDQKKCLCSILNCQQCDSKNYGQCEICNTNYDKIGGNQCQCSVVNCKVCNKLDGAQCDQCEEKYVFDKTKSKCTLCKINNCKQCKEFEPEQCDHCEDGYNKTPSHQCKIAIDKCLELDSLDKNVCKQCEQNYTFDTFSAQCSCNLQNCLDCNIDLNGKCIQCQDGFTWDSSKNMCKCSLNNCQDCSTKQYGNCEKCIQGYTLNSLNQCQCSLSNCEKCNSTNGNYCDLCKQGYVSNIQKDSCLKCQVKNCQDCLPFNEKQCETCEKGYSFNNNNNTECIINIENCEQLEDNQSNIIKCKKCNLNYNKSISGDKCHCSVDNCKVCNKQDGSVCDTCIKGFSPDANKQCQENSQKCNVENCQDCKKGEENNCEKCKQGYEVDIQSSNKNQQCKPSIDKCIELNQQNVNLCEKCFAGFKPSKTKQICEELCTVVNCKECDQLDNKICKECVDSYVSDLTNSICNKCQVSDCKQCAIGNGSSCKECNSGYQIKAISTEVSNCEIISIKYSFNLKQQLQKDGYMVSINFQNKLTFQKNSMNHEDLQKLFKVNISNKSKYSINFSVKDSQTVEIRIIMKEECKKEDFSLEIIDSQFEQVNNLSINKDKIELEPFTLITESTKDKTDGVKVAAKTANNIAWSSSIPLGLFGDLFSIFSIVDVTAYIYFLFYINVRHPYNIAEFSKLFGSFQFAYIPDYILPDIDQNHVISSPQKFMNNGIDAFFLKNASPSYSFVIIILSLYILFKLISFIPLGKFQRLLKRAIRSGWEFDAFIYTIWIIFSYLCVSCVLQLREYEMIDSLSKVSYFFFISTCVVLLSVPIIFGYLIHSRSVDLALPSSKRKSPIRFTSIVRGLKINLPENKVYPADIGTQAASMKDIEGTTRPSSSAGYQFKSLAQQSSTSIDDYSSTFSYKGNNLSEKEQQEKQKGFKSILKYTNVIFFVRKLIFGLIIVMLHDQTYVQLSLLSAFNVLFASYFFISKPYIRMFDNIKQGITEVFFVSLQIISAFLKNDFKSQTEDERIQIGWVYVGLCLTILFIHTLYLLIEASNSMFKFFKNFFRRTSKTMPIVVNNEGNSPLKKNISADSASAQNLDQAKPQSLITFDGNQNPESVEKALNNNKEKLDDGGIQQDMDLDELKKSRRRLRGKFFKRNPFVPLEQQSSLVNIPNIDSKLSSAANISIQGMNNIGSSNVSFSQDSSPVKLLKK